MTTAEARRPGGTAYVVVAVVALLLMLPIGFFYLISGLVVPGPWLFLLWVLYLAMVALAVWLTGRRSWWVAAVPVGAAALWIAFLTTGERVFGWQA